MKWLWPEVISNEQIVEAMMAEHYTTIPHFKPQYWVLFHQPGTLEEAIALMEAYVSTEASLYLIPEAWKKKGVHHRGGECSPEDQD